MTIWQDTKPVCMLPTAWNPAECVTVRGKKDSSTIDVNCPQVIHTYNSNMGGVQYCKYYEDQYHKYYEIRMKSHKFYKYVFWFLISILNTYIIQRFSPRTYKPFNNYEDFRVELAKKLIGTYQGEKRRRRPRAVLLAQSSTFPMKVLQGSLLLLC